MSTMKTSQTRPSHLAHRALGALAALTAAAVIAVGFGPATAAADEVPDSLAGPSVNLAFPGQSATVVDSGAVIAVKCKGPRGSSCTGTVALHLGGATHKASFSVEGGARQSIVVPLGRDGGAAVARHRARVVASTMQPLGACRHTERVLRLR